jgi:hypothetical protein
MTKIVEKRRVREVGHGPDIARLGFFRGFLPVFSDIQTLSSTSKVHETQRQKNARHTYTVTQTHNHIHCTYSIVGIKSALT